MALDPPPQVKVIRSTHKRLRDEFSECKDFSKVWKKHCSDNQGLKEYSEAMYELATDVWGTKCDGKDRTTWCKDTVKEYFHKGKLEEILEKDKRRQEYYEQNKDNFFIKNPNESTKTASFVPKINEKIPTQNAQTASNLRKIDEKVRLLDVGSCYNPFHEIEDFETTAVDITPANKQVYQCDFLTVDISAENQSNGPDFDVENARKVTALPKNHFNVVVFSLLLSYIPCPHARFQMCEKAHKVLTTNGLLLIITPDSSHQNKHASNMKKWKAEIEDIGFCRVKYEKDKHLHLIAFRKIPSNFIIDKRSGQNTKLEKLLNIPQDFNNTVDNTCL
uniref:S-adenosylmethionine sensor upstream of mTORC1 n=1 Tax=Ciona intestinalis TaxID=7719 RepID=Q4H2G1_CIOIN|nr:uncharacterized protein LOC778832 [Ciona intestinalis]BAE06816.1 hypothetical protein [Ciona intestinalis]|eukprot:NP_001071884.1 uncharacterized protein LOC778832 [Ciona intestinalis]